MTIYINGQAISNCIVRNEIIDDIDTMTIDVIDYVLVDKKNSDKYILDVDADDAEKLSQVIRGDMDNFIGKKIKVIIQSLGKAGR